MASACCCRDSTTVDPELLCRVSCMDTLTAGLALGPILGRSGMLSAMVWCSRLPLSPPPWPACPASMACLPSLSLLLWIRNMLPALGRSGGCSKEALRSDPLPSVGASGSRLHRPSPGCGPKLRAVLSGSRAKVLPACRAHMDMVRVHAADKQADNFSGQGASCRQAMQQRLFVWLERAIRFGWRQGPHG